MEILLVYHGYSLCRAYLCTYSASFAVFQIYLDRDGFTDYSIRAIEPALKTGRLILPDREALFLVYHRKRATPLTCPPPFTDAR